MSQTNLDLIKAKCAERHDNTLLKSLGIEIIEISKNSVTGKMPIDARTHQIYGYLHGGASVAFAETLCSIGAAANIDVTKQKALGMEINANHLRVMESGWVQGEAKPIHLGKKTQIWEIKITDDENKLVCISRCTMVIV